MTKHTPGAIRVAVAITGGSYGDKAHYPTSYGYKTVEGIADLIDRETAAPDLLEACKAAQRALRATSRAAKDYTYECDVLQAAIAKAEGASAAQTASSTLTGTTLPELLRELENLRNEARGYLRDLARHQVDATTLVGAIRRAEQAIAKAKGIA